MNNVFMTWHFMERFQQRRIMFKGGSTAVKETEAQRASAEVAVENYNNYMKYIKPFEDKAVADITGDSSAREATLHGMTNADMAQKMRLPGIDPTKGMAPAAEVGKVLSKAQVSGSNAFDDNQAKNFQAVVDMGQGKATSAQQGMSSLAQQSVQEASNVVENEVAASNASMSAGATGLGIAAGMTKNIYDDTYNKK